MTEFDRILKVATNAAESASEVLQRSFGRAEIQFKQSQNLVTQADLESEETIVACIRKEFPDHRFLREEGNSTGSGNEDHLWIIDPLDATNNYAHGIPHFSVSIAYAEQGEVQVGVVIDPCRNEVFTAVRGQGARLNGQSINVSARGSLKESIIVTGFFYDRGMMMERTLDSIKHLFQANIRGIRRTGGAALDLCWVACGRFDGFFEYQLAAWDYAAGSLIVQEAGGQCADRDGEPLNLLSGSVIIGNRNVFDELVGVVRW